MQFALDLAELFKEDQAETVLVVNRFFGKGALKLSPTEAAEVKRRAEVVATLHQPIFHGKTHPYEKLPRTYLGVWDRFIRRFNRPGSLRPVLYFAVEDYRAGNFKSVHQFTQFLSSLKLRARDIPDLLMVGLGAFAWVLLRRGPGRWISKAVDRFTARRHHKKEHPLSTQTTYTVLRDRFLESMRQERGYAKAFSRLRPTSRDLLIYQTAELADLVVLSRELAKRKSLRETPIKLVLRTPIWNREGNMLEPPEETKLLRKTLLELRNHSSRIEMFVDTTELADQFATLGFKSIRVLPILFGADLTRRFEEASVKPLSVSTTGPVKMLRAGSAQREKGFLVMPDLVKAAQIAVASGSRPVHFTIQATMLRYQRRWDRLIAAINRLRWFDHGDIKVVTKDVSTEQYAENLVDCDVVLSPNRSVPYMHGSTGTTIEAIRAGKPVITMGENWGARQLRNLDLYVDHLQTFAQKTGVATHKDDSFVQDPLAFQGAWKDISKTWAPFCHIEEWWQLSWDIARRAEYPVPEGVTEVIVFLSNDDRQRPGDIAKVAIQEIRTQDELRADRAAGTLYEFAEPASEAPIWRYFGGERKHTANIWRLRQGARSVRLGLVLLDRRTSLDHIKLEVVMCSNPDRALPISAAGYMADNPFELMVGMEEVGHHLDHYQRTARTAAAAVSKFHNRETFLEVLMGEKAGSAKAPAPSEAP
uniref:Uncharacterized protein n=1 Tax=Caulobacter sp. (strain K31) TaxID=366602 RepID=B0T5A1_CAUSK